MTELPQYKIEFYSNDDQLPAEAEEFLATQLADSREPLPEDRPDRDQWRFACICAVTDHGHVLGGVHLDMGPVNFGPLANDKLAYLEHLLVRPQYRRQGIATKLLRRAVAVTKAAGCQYIRCNTSWDNPPAIALFKKCGFALTDVDEPDQGGQYFTVKPLQGYGCNP